MHVKAVFAYQIAVDLIAEIVLYRLAAAIANGKAIQPFFLLPVVAVEIRKGIVRKNHLFARFLSPSYLAMSSAAAACSRRFSRLALSSSVRIGRYTLTVIPGYFNIVGSPYTS
jgi:hypothetical protein